MSTTPDTAEHDYSKLFDSVQRLNEYRLKLREKNIKDVSFFSVEEQTFIRTLYEQLQHFGASLKTSAEQRALVGVLNTRVEKLGFFRA